MASLEQHRALLQEAVAIVFESRKEEAKLLTTNVDDLSIATQLLSELQRQQEMESRGLLNFADKVWQQKLLPLQIIFSSIYFEILRE